MERLAMTSENGFAPHATREGGAEKAAAIVKNHMIMAAGFGLIPIPLVDVAALTVIQLEMLMRLAALYKVDYSKESGRAVIASLVGGGTSTIAAIAAFRLLYKFVPGPGWVAGAMSSSVSAGASTYALGKVFIQHFDSGGTFLTFDPRKVREYYRKEFEKGSQEVRETFAGVKP
ncbi:MAG: YcjF family protein [Actinomycetota bacterium]